MQIETMIYTIRNQRVMIDSELAELYGVETKILNQAVKRNPKRFPEDFMFECDSRELEDLRSQFVTANRVTTWNFKRRTMPMLFTENGVAMLSTVLNSDRAIHVNMMIMRTFTKIRNLKPTESNVDQRLSKLEKGTNQLFKIVFERLDNLEDQITPKLPSNRKKIGLHHKKD